MYTALACPDVGGIQQKQQKSELVPSAGATNPSQPEIDRHPPAVTAERALLSIAESTAPNKQLAAVRPKSFQGKQGSLPGRRQLTMARHMAARLTGSGSTASGPVEERCVYRLDEEEPRRRRPRARNNTAHSSKQHEVRHQTTQF